MSDTQLIRCPVCGAANRVPREKIGQGLEPVCGPTLLAPKAGREVDRIVGAQPKSEIARRLERVMA
jgi:thioredoxin-like negative regulator of GroEL